MIQLTGDRADAIRAGLIAHAAEESPRRRRGLQAAGWALSGVLVGTGATFAAYAATGTEAPAAPSSKGFYPTEIYGAPIPAPDGVVPGSSVRELLGTPSTREFAAAIDVPLGDRPEGATDVHVKVRVMEAGTLTVSAGSGDFSTWSHSWSEEDLKSGGTYVFFSDLALTADAGAVKVRPADGFVGTIAIQYVRQTPTQLGINENGQTFGVGRSLHEVPDLVYRGDYRFEGERVLGYARVTDLRAFSPDDPFGPTDPAELERAQRERERRYPNGWDVSVYLSDGRTQVGTFHVGPRSGSLINGELLGTRPEFLTPQIQEFD
ncbi:hypothetical protein [Aeromicrobium sp. HA]|uniref:hypothetical protein n=1 Tax=Aeromicrobium sp. HA TaxID=3009077 RepID=UPI0022AE5C7C|nr:hypothetical protein [Aeromicrobium sp. HA]